MTSTITRSLTTALAAIGAAMAATALATAPTQAAATQQTSARECTGLLCGDVHNRFSHGMYTTETINSGPHWCDIWNGGGGSTSSWWHTQCTHKYLAPGASRGGNGVDVDAFTFADRDYMLNFHGTLSWRIKGVWTRIHDYEEASCSLQYDYGVPTCSVIYG